MLDSRRVRELKHPRTADHPQALSGIRSRQASSSSPARVLAASSTDMPSSAITVATRPGRRRSGSRSSAFGRPGSRPRRSPCGRSCSGRTPRGRRRRGRAGVRSEGRGGCGGARRPCAPPPPHSNQRWGSGARLR
ncbi:hypothetical protein LP52_20790 [Streptomonospora alba]|uniref:Uncharacterized protein n=1 Tax=Streptomonospora alba TaxID=183763 RepID=A0A0C2G1J1_9ACTN|nr:hypothetical protein LP52_20790 [Streptomonospora alba]